MMGRTDYGHDHDAEAIQHMINRAEVDLAKAKAASEAATAVYRQSLGIVADLKRRMLRVGHKRA